LVEARFPKCLTVHVGFDVSTKVLFDAIVDNRDAVGGNEVGSDVARAGKVSSVVSETGDIMVLRKLALILCADYFHGHKPR
jgi:hypothetical protein